MGVPQRARAVGRTEPGISIAEPATLLTDYLLAAVAFGLGWDVLRRNRRDPQKARRLWGLALVGLALAAFAGGTWHGFSHALGETPAAVLWKTTVCLIGVVDLLMLWGSLAAALPRRWQATAIAAALVKFAAYAVVMTARDEFRFVVYDSVSSMLVILLVHAIPGSVRREPGARFLLAGLLLSFAAAAVQFFRIAPHPRFNHNDLYHVVQIGATWLLARGARELRDR